jgi:hypothetical protein
MLLKKTTPMNREIYSNSRIHEAHPDFLRCVFRYLNCNFFSIYAITGVNEFKLTGAKRLKGARYGQMQVDPVKRDRTCSQAT